MSSLNRVELIGHLGQDPEIRSAHSGDRIASLSLATSERWKDKSSGETKERTEWHRIVIFNDGLVGVVERYLKKGAKIFIEGALQTRKWTDNNGTERYTTEIVLQKFGGRLILLDRQEGNRPPPAASAEDYGRGATRSAAPAHGDIDDEIPF